MIDYSTPGIVWYAMQTTYKRELRAKEYLNSQGIECFVPMEQVLSSDRGRQRLMSRPAIHNLIFVKADTAQLRSVKERINYLHNRLIKQDSQLIPIIVPTDQMEMFIQTNMSLDSDITYVDLSMTPLDKGTRVRITDGEFKGQEGILTKIKGRRNRRVVINVEGVVAYGLEIKPENIERI